MNICIKKRSWASGKFDLARSLSRAAAVAVVAGAAITLGVGGTAKAEDRTIDGIGNNPLRPTAGAADTPLLRFGYFANYADGVGSMDWGDMLPNPRDISNRISTQTGSVPNDRGLSDYIWQWGQFLTHDMDLTGNTSSNGTAAIPTNDAGDPLGPNPIPFSRSNYDPGTGTSVLNPREQINQITSFIDASNVYGSDETRAAALRTMSGGMLKMSDGGLPGFNTEGLPNDNPVHRPTEELFLAGDVRANEQPGLTAMHTIFLREHNRLADLIVAQNPTLSDEEIYQRARKIVGAEMQIITYNEFLPALMGEFSPSPEDYRYLPTLAPEVTQTFATAIFRFGHSMNGSSLRLVDHDGKAVGELALRDAFFNPNILKDNPANVDLILKGLSTQLAQENDVLAVDEIRNFLFGPPGAGGLDLISLDIQRGRDHGLPFYNEARESYGLPEVEDVSEITSDPEIQQALIELYKLDEDPENIERLDLFVAMLAEDHLPGTSLGLTAFSIIHSQFTRLRDGDRFFYLNDRDLYDEFGLLNADIASILDLDGLRLSDVIKRNTGITNLQSNIFFVPEPGTWTLGLLVWAGVSGRGRTAGRERNIATAFII